jgi:hypothetical protein
LENRDEFIKIAVTNSEKKRYKLYSQKVFGSDYHLSEFIRQAVREKIKRIDNPSLFRSNDQVSPVMIEKINKNSELLQELKEKNLKSENLFDELKDTLNLISSYTTTPTSREREKVISLFKGFKSLSQKDLVRKTNFDKKTIFSIITDLRDQGIVRLKANGVFTLDE